MVLTHALGFAGGCSRVNEVLQHACKGCVPVCPPIWLQSRVRYLEVHSLWLLALHTEIPRLSQKISGREDGASMTAVNQSYILQMHAGKGMLSGGKEPKEGWPPLCQVAGAHMQGEGAMPVGLRMRGVDDMHTPGGGAARVQRLLLHR